MNIEFAWSWMLAALPLPLLVAWLVPRAPRDIGDALRVPFFAALGAVTVQSDARKHHARLVLAALAWVLLVASAARPQVVGEPIRLPVEGRDIMLAVDISGSMEARDMELAGYPVDRLSAVKAVAGDFTERRQGDRLGLILFGQQAYLQTPLTFDRETVRTLLNESVIGLAGKETAIGDAIGLGVKRLRDQPDDNRVMVLLTDGANTAGTVDPLKAADLAAQAGIRIHTIGFGADGFGVGLFGTSAEIDEGTLRTISDKTGGRYFRARDTRSLLSIYAMLDEIEPVSQEDETFRPVREIYWWPLAGSLALSALVALLVAGLPGFYRQEVAHAR